MGPVKSIIESLDSSKDADKAAREVINIGIQLLQKRFALFEAELNLPIGQVEKLPAKYLVTYSRKMAISVTSKTEKIEEEIHYIVDSFCKGNIAKGISNLLKSSLDLILSSYSAGYNQSKDYMVVTNEMGGLFRIDYLVVQQKIQAQGITQKVSDVFGSYLIISSVDVKEIAEGNVFKILISRQFPELLLTQKFLLMKLIQDGDLTEEEFQKLESAYAKTPSIKLKELKNFRVQEKVKLTAK